MNWDTIQQVIRILAYALGSYFLGTGVADGELFQQALGGLAAVGAFAWWLIVERNKAKA
jgi:hypothetical protein